MDKSGIELFGIDISNKLNDITQRIYSFAGEEFNINSPKQLGEVLFEKLRLPVKKKTKTGYSTNAEVLESLRFEHPIIPEILEYRTSQSSNPPTATALLKKSARTAGFTPRSIKPRQERQDFLHGPQSPEHPRKAGHRQGAEKIL